MTNILTASVNKWSIKCRASVGIDSGLHILVFHKRGMNSAKADLTMDAATQMEERWENLVEPQALNIEALNLPTWASNLEPFI